MVLPVTWIDYSLYLIIIFCALWGGWKGFSHALLTFLGWSMVLIGALSLGDNLGAWLLPNQSLTVQLVAGGLIVGLVVGAICWLIRRVLCFVIAFTPLWPIDKALGLILGGMKGILFNAVLLILISTHSTWPKSILWKHSVMIQAHQPVVQYVLTVAQKTQWSTSWSRWSAVIDHWYDAVIEDYKV